MSYHGEATKPHFPGSIYQLEIKIHSKISKTTAELSEAELSAIFLKSAQAVTTTKNPENKHSNTSKTLEGELFHRFLNSSLTKGHNLH